MGKAVTLEASVPYDWPQQKFFLKRGVNFIENFDALPENIRRKIRFLVKGGVLSVVGDRSAIDAAEEAASSSNAAPPVQEPTRDVPEQVERRADATSPTPQPGPVERTAAANDVANRPSTDNVITALGRASRFGRLFDVLCPVLVHSLRLSIILEIMKQEGIGTSRLSRLLRRPRQTVSEHVSALERAGILKYDRATRRYSVDPEWVERIDRHLRRTDDGSTADSSSPSCRDGHGGPTGGNETPKRTSTGS